MQTLEHSPRDVTVGSASPSAIRNLGEFDRAVMIDY